MSYLTRTTNNRVLSRSQSNRVLTRSQSSRTLARTLGNISISISNANTISTGTTAPATTPGGVGYVYINTATGQAYLAFGTSSAADWKEVFISG